MLEGLSDSLSQTMKKLAGMSIIDKQTLKEVTKDIQRALIQSDVNVKVVFALTKKLKKELLKKNFQKV